MFCFLSVLLTAQRKSENAILKIVKSQSGNEFTKTESDDALEININDFHKSKQSQLEHYYFQQSYHGIEIIGTESSIHLKPDGSVFKFNNRLKNSLKSTTKSTLQPSVNPIQAVQHAAKHLGYETTGDLEVLEHTSFTNRSQKISKGSLSRRIIPAKLVYTISENGQLRLAWDLAIYETKEEEWWNMRVDANSGEIIDKVSWMAQCNFDHGESTHQCTSHRQKPPHITSISLDQTEEKEGFVGGYRVYPMPLAHPGEGARTMVLNPDNATASPFGWHDTNGAIGAEFLTTQGNNVHAFDDGNNQGYSPFGGSGLIFDFPLDLSLDPEFHEDAALTNLFYWSNIAHDILYQYGFDESSGNFQENNYGRGGVSSDYVNARSQAGLLCNATFGTPSDGSIPTMSMFICNGRDVDFSSAVILHEYAHGLSNRLTGGPSSSGCLGNAEQMGEGWSDYLGLLLTMKTGDQSIEPRPFGDWFFNDPDGIRPFPYSTEMTINPHTYASSFSGTSLPHGIGSVWCMMLWEMTWDLIAQNGFDIDWYNGTGGNNIALQLVVEGMKLQPCSPGFVDGRDAILEADQILYGGANQCLIWGAFSKRGLGANADQGSSINRADGAEAFNLPSACGGTGCLLKLQGSSSISVPYIASNNNSLQIESDGNWSVTTSAPWITIDTTSGSGDGTAVYDIAENSTFSPRRDTIKITCTGFTRNFVVLQDAKPCIQLFSPIPYFTDFEGGAIDSFWCPISSEPHGRIRVSNIFGPRKTRHLLMDCVTSGDFAVNEAKLGLDLLGAPNVELKFWWKEFNEETDIEDGVFLSDDGGLNYKKVFDFKAGNPNYTEVKLNISQLAADNGLSLTSTFVIKFQQYDNLPIAADGIAIDDISIQSITCNVGSPCDDNNACTINDVHTNFCACQGTFEDADADEVCDADDKCPGFDDNIDLDGDGKPDACDLNVFCGCPFVISNFPHIEGFEVGDGNICQFSGDDFDWEIRSGSTTSSSTGPDSAYQGINYFYIESSSPNYPNKEGVFQGACYDLSSSDSASINFWYHMYGSGMGMLNLEITTDQGANWVSVWSLSGNQGNSWYNVNIDLSNYTGGMFSYRFNGGTILSFTSDFALDQITVDIGPLNCIPGASCDDNDACTINDMYNLNCKCLGTFDDTDNDGVCNAQDQCQGYDDHIDFDEDNTPDACDLNVFCNSCSTLISTYPHVENFEIGVGSICQYVGDDFDWAIVRDSTASLNTGPDSAYQGLNYFFIESSIPNHPKKIAAFESGCYDLGGARAASIDFWYHMYGLSIGTLSLEITTNQGDNWITVWSLTGNQGNNWQHAAIDLSSYVGGTLSYRFTGTTALSFTGDMALDQIMVDVVAAKECKVCKATSPVVVNGNANDWNANDTLFFPEVQMLGTVDSTKDLSGQFQVKWDTNYLYLFCKVQDDVLVNNSLNPWDDDGIEIFIDGGNEKDTVYDTNDHQLIFRYNDSTVYDQGKPDNPAGVRFNMVIDSGSYDIEVKISWTYIGVAPPTIGKKIGLDIHINDDDHLTPSPRDAVIAWTDVNDEADQNPSVFGTITLDDCAVPSLTYNLKAILEGAYDTSTGLMRSDLYQLELLPGMIFSMPNQPGLETPSGQPYDAFPWNYQGIEGQTYGNSDYAPTSVDWVLMSLRTGIDASTEIHQAAGILKTDGTIEFLPGSAYQGNDPGPYYVLIEHRNHIGALSAQALTPQNGEISYDFSKQESWVSPNSGFGQKRLSPNLWGLYAGDGNQAIDVSGYDINGADRILWNYDNGLFNQYLGSDFDLNGDTSGADRIFWNQNTGISSGVPK